jgi:hypothetical protein
VNDATLASNLGRRSRFSSSDMSQPIFDSAISRPVNQLVLIITAYTRIHSPFIVTLPGFYTRWPGERKDVRVDTSRGSESAPRRRTRIISPSSSAKPDG